MISRACTSVWYCDTCDGKWSYGGATHEIADDRAKRDGWATMKMAPMGMEMVRHICPTCVRNNAKPTT